jgi:hypothetical protein
VILTGTPEGVVNVDVGDEVVCEIEGLGRLVNRIAGDAEFGRGSAASQERRGNPHESRASDRRTAGRRPQLLRDVDPATQDVLAEVARGGPAEIDAAVTAAKRAFPAWAKTPPAERARLMRRLGDLISGARAALSETETRDTGQVIAQTRSSSCRARPTTSTTSPRSARASTATPIRRRRTSTTRSISRSACAR